MQSREYKCFNKIISVCNNRGFGDLGNEIMKSVASKYLKQSELKELSHEMPKAIKFANKLSFLDNVNFSNDCTRCQKVVEKGDPAFVQGKSLYHVLCAKDVFKDDMESNIYYKRWAAKITPINSDFYEEEDQ